MNTNKIVNECLRYMCKLHSFPVIRRKRVRCFHADTVSVVPDTVPGGEKEEVHSFVHAAGLCYILPLLMGL